MEFPCRCWSFVPSFNNPEDALLYIGKEAVFGAATSFAGAQAGKIIGPALSKLGNSVGGWFKHGFQTYAQESLQTVLINGKPITTTIEVGIKATKQYVSKALGSSVGNVAKGGVQYTKSNLKLGQEMHKVYKADIADGITTFKEFTKVPGIRPDFVDFKTKTIYELKPFNPRRIREGLKQLDKYKLLFEQKYGGTWNTILEHY